MAAVRQGTAARWAAVLAGAAALALAPALPGAASPPEGTPPARAVLAAALHSATVAHSGLVQVDGWLGLPSRRLQSDAMAQLDRNIRVRTWWISPTVWRTDVLAPTGPWPGLVPARLSAAATQAWEQERAAVLVRATLPGLPVPRTADLMPPAAARALLAWISTADRVRALPPRRIAGHDAAGAEVLSGEPSSSVGVLDVWVDTLTGLPLELDLYGRGNAVPLFRTRFLEVTTQRPDAAVVSPAVAPRTPWLPAVLAALAAGSGADVPAGLATRGAGFARVALLDVPTRLLPRVEAAIGAPMLDLGSGRAAVLRGGLLQVAVLETAGGRGYLLAGTLTGTAMDAAVRSALSG